ncbi:MAG: pantetheine-phosphate adenylyltransferase [Flavobacteriales bacterium]|jgi:pantetheine-phosphate adenylyltransferase|nr:pantetheine-phosphate adenylyltransferase [Flavobacteriales bacterium]NCG29079.1 pantetheine-phosphate adenylyltransferase [Bacteroidota bacterium]MBT3963413.1 pantetheine-phosphate adenylyltransferase [Flavobacteriales bacterium]MBT4704955.1 pantetheine-phosphate adenylyltransferase [Flavobacteriales bacterium]MBT4929730.1 pantetheine-phosphate adenylyltransferase [Flavobacteriales bacterium]
MKTAVFPGTFDPFTLGHESIVRKAIPLFDKIVVAIGINSTKSAHFELNKRVEWINQTFSDAPQVEVGTYEGLTVDFCLEKNAEYILRGLRNPTDYQYESSIAQMNHAMQPGITSVFLVCDPEYAAINSSIVREIFKSGGDISRFLPQTIVLD